MYRISKRKAGCFVNGSKVYAALFAVLAFLVLTSFSFPQSDVHECLLKFEYKVDHTTGSNSNGKIYLKRIEGEGPFTIKLYDLESGENRYLKTVKQNRLSNMKMTLIFKGLAPSTYLIKVENGDCSRSVTGIEGILIK